jgi:hypothetical protein
MRIDSDIDIDLGDRDKLLAVIKHIPAAMYNAKVSTRIDHRSPTRKHATGVYITDIPYNPIHDMAAIDYKEAEKRGYFKLDLLNLHIYNQIRDEEHLVELMQEPDWSMLKDKETVEKLLHLNNSYYLIRHVPEPIDSIPRLAMFLAAIRPAKRHLLGKKWKEINETVWDKDPTGYSFKRSHAVAYAQLVVVHMNLLKVNTNENR